MARLPSVAGPGLDLRDTGVNRTLSAALGEKSCYGRVLRSVAPVVSKDYGNEKEFGKEGRTDRL